jgi:hypothetical protein
VEVTVRWAEHKCTITSHGWKLSPPTAGLLRMVEYARTKETMLSHDTRLNSTRQSLDVHIYSTCTVVFRYAIANAINDQNVNLVLDMLLF